MKTCQADACGKVILFGEHSVVYGYPAIAMPLMNIRLKATVAKTDSDKIEEPDLEIREKLVQTIETARQLLGINCRISLKITSQIPIGAGLGSSAALNVAVTRALAKLEGMKRTAAQTAATAFEMEKIYHGTPSGIDTTVSSNEKPIYFIKGQNPDFIAAKQISLVIANTGTRAPTKQVVAEVREKREKDTGKYDQIMAEIGEISGNARQCLQEGNVKMIGTLMNRNQKLLEQLGVSSPELNRLIATATDNGALGAKLSGAGKGGCIVAVAESKKKAEGIADALRVVSKNAFHVTV
ncbi:mevalonate kinase [Candidatus Woesearchaeota archaeon]|nr:mevalonate kinase [Candidatus Woesearchaeota archaeon]